MSSYILEKRFKETIDLSDFLTTEQACFYLGVHPRTLRRWVATGKIKKYHGKGYGVRAYYVKEELKQFILDGVNRFKYNHKVDIDDK